MDRHPLLVFGAAAALGAAAGLQLPAEPRLITLCATAIFCIVLALRAEMGPLRAAAALALVAGAFGGLWHAVAQPSVATHTQRLACTILGNVAYENQSVSYQCVTDGGMKLAVSGAGTVPAIGGRVLLRGRLEPFDLPRNPGEPDERAIARERGDTARMTGARVLRALPQGPFSLDVALARAHHWAFEQLRTRLPEPSATILAGELWGERASLPPELRAEFQETGTVHVLVTAGLHLGVVALLVLTFLRTLTLPRGVACALAIAAVWAYAIFSGAHVPALRAACMASIALTAYGLGRAASGWNVLGAALLGIALFDPLAIGGASFALSFSCVAAIMLCAGTIDEYLQAVAALPHRFREIVALTLATQLGTWPLTASLFLLFAPYAVLANLAVVPCVGATMILGMLQLAFASLPDLAQAAANLNGWILAWIVAVVHTLASLPGSAVPAMPPPLWSIVAYDCLLTFAVMLWKRGAPRRALALFACGVLIAALPPRVPDHNLRIMVLDVGQADAIVVRTPHNHTILIDAGGRLEQGHGAESSAELVGQRIVVPYLRRQGIRTIDALILSHPHGDHVGGFAPVLRTLGVSEFADSGQQYPGYAYHDAITTARADRVPIVYPRAGALWKTDDGITVQFLGPSLPFITGSQNDINNNSIAFVLQYKRFRMLFTGDAGAEAEQRFLSEGIDLHADVLKVGHHGSAYSSTPAFIAAVHPRYAVISVGRHNLFGHPAPSTIETLRRFGARVYRTDENGGIIIRSDGGSASIDTMLANHLR